MAKTHFKAQVSDEVPTTFLTIANQLGKLVTDKNKAYGDSFAKCKKFLELLWPDGVPVDKYTDMLAIVRVFDKMMRIATQKEYAGENPWQDIGGYCLLSLYNEHINQ